MLRRGGTIWIGLAVMGVTGCLAAFAVAGGAAGEGCKGNHCATASAKATTTETTATTATASAGNGPAQLLFDGDFDTASYQPWSAAQASNYGHANNPQVHFGPFNVDNQTVGQAPYSGRFQLPAWSGGKTRSQLIHYRSVNVGSDDYYSLMFYVPAGWTPGTTAFWGVSIAEFNFQNLGPGGPTIALQAHADHVTVAMQTGTTTTTFPNYQYRSNADVTGGPNLPPLYAIPRPMQLGVWHELVVHAHWASNKTGVLETWHRLKGQTGWTKTASLSGYPTLQSNPNGTVPTSTLDVIQAYRGASMAPVTVWLDGFSQSPSFAAAAGNMP
jgi:Polysaccharide lyase